MKRIQFAVVLFAALACSGLQAQTAMHANIPFEFRMGAAAFPAGEYSIDCSNHVLFINNRDGKSSAAMALTVPLLRPQLMETGILEFNRYDDAYFLSKIWVPGSTEGAALPKSAREKELASRATSISRETVIIATK
jgi:hypothetical protein